MESKNKNKGFPYNLATALDCAIRDFEVEKDTKKYGYKVKDNIYYNYMSNEYWESYKKDMPEEHRKQFDNGSGGELKEKKGRWGIYPPKMASFGSSSRMIYELSKDIPGFCFEEQLDTRVGGIANLDGFLKKDNKYIYIEAKRREIYSSTHENEEISEAYLPVYDKIKEKCEAFSYTQADCDKKGYKKITFVVNKEIVLHFDLKQVICHFLGITYDLAKHAIKSPNVKFVYLLYNPQGIEDKLDEKYKVKVLNRYTEVQKFIKTNIDQGVFNSIFQAVLNYQIDKRIKINFEMKLVVGDKESYKEEFK